MRIVRIKGANGTQHAIETTDRTYAVSPFADDIRSQIANWMDLRSLLQRGSLPAVMEADVSLLAPVPTPGKIICIGKNYADHAREMGAEPPSIPVVFSKFNSAISGPDATIFLPAISNKVDFEAELVVIIGKRGRHIQRDEAMSHVFGYCCGNDVSARDWQKEKPGGQWLLGKTFDSFAPIGPCLVTADEIEDPHNLNIEMRLNGVTMQDSNTKHLIFPIDYLISHLSKFVTLEPGDLIFTGTPEGVGAGRKPPVFLKHGDVLEVEIEKIGKLTNHVVRETENMS